jgi:hypothetical protein
MAVRGEVTGYAEQPCGEGQAASLVFGQSRERLEKDLLREVGCFVRSGPDLEVAVDSVNMALVQRRKRFGSLLSGAD